MISQRLRTGSMIRFLDYNDGYTSTGESGHPSDSIAAVLTTAELRRCSGKDAIVATVLAYEIFCRRLRCVRSEAARLRPRHRRLHGEHRGGGAPARD